MLLAGKKGDIKIKKFGNILFIATGHVSLAFGVAGIFLPVLPTTPFLLLSAACYAKGSKTFYDRLTRHKTFGPYINGYLNGKGMAIKAKICSISFMWIFMTVSALFFVPVLGFKIALFIIAAAVTVYIIRQPVKKGEINGE
ncbi:MAG: DUF454 domain-containing protein [Candidatus Goldiibacteriota bacterium HGW-Goldbacteria-1]|nr:MAG: DUF454 domain-containing protein [Candidatus Goldiibacteriota bacterium HGW-Goldbacteria-1]